MTQTPASGPEGPVTVPAEIVAIDRDGVTRRLHGSRAAHDSGADDESDGESDGQ